MLIKNNFFLSNKYLTNIKWPSKKKGTPYSRTYFAFPQSPGCIEKYIIKLKIKKHKISILRLAKNRGIINK